MMRRDLQTLVLTALFLSLSCPAVVQAGDWVERSDAPYAGGYGVDAFYMFNWFDKSDLSTQALGHYYPTNCPITPQPSSANSTTCCHRMF
jgi:hypothetical protein